MRVWEVDEKKETPSDLVREQDFIMRVRRMQRTGSTYLILNFVLSAIKPLAQNQKLREEAHNKFREYAASTKGSYYEMSNEDVFLVWENPGDAQLMAGHAIELALDAYKDGASSFLLTFRMPENYAALRERTNTYVEGARARPPEAVEEGNPFASGGHLTAKALEQIEHLFSEADIRRYGRTQNIYQDNKGKWKPIAEEYFISFEDLRREHFPKVDVAQSEHLFMALCSMFDLKLLTAFTAAYDTISSRTINLNLSISSIMGSIFAQFVRSVPRDKRNLIGFELNSGDLFQDFSRTISAIQSLRREGFRVAIDGVTPDMASFIDLNRFPVDRIKINVSKDRISQTADPTVRNSLERLPPEKLIFFRCDNELALNLGRELGVSIFQGWLIDDLAVKKD